MCERGKLKNLAFGFCERSCTNLCKLQACCFAIFRMDCAHVWTICLNIAPRCGGWLV
jgi:hypothetical protein